MADLTDIESVKDEIAKAVVKLADECSKAHDQHKEEALNIYYAYIGQFKAGEEPDADWKSKLYPKQMKPKILAAWSQSIQAVTSNKNMWNVVPRGMETIGPDAAGAKRMQGRLNDNADRCDYQESVKTGMFDMLLYGTQFMQVPTVESRMKRQWMPDKSSLGKRVLAAMGRPIYAPAFVRETYPSALPRNYFEMYPWPYSSDLQKGEGVFHRPFISKYDLNDLMDEPGYDKAAIAEMLERQPGEAKDSRIDQKMEARKWGGKRRKGYDLIFFTGKLGRDRLSLNSMPGFEKEFGRYSELLAWVINHAVGPKLIKLKANPTPGKYRPFISAHYEQMPYESLGMGIGKNSYDLAKAMGGVLRLYADGKKAAMPMIGVDRSKMPPGSTVEFYPMKIWDFRGINPKDALFPVQLPDMTNGLLMFFELLERLHDEITGLPKWTTGVDSKMLNKTATGISMIMNASSQLVRGAVENMQDYIIEPTGDRWYDWFMENDQDPSIKGDYIVAAAGLASMMQKESLNTQLMGLLSMVVNPMVMQNPYAMKLLRMVGDNIGIEDVDEVLPNPDKLAAVPGINPAEAAASVPISEPGAPSPQPVAMA